MQCLRLSLSADSNHAPSYNNLGVLEMRHGHCEQARAFFQAAGSLAPYLFEPHYNFAKLAEKVKYFCFPYYFRGMPIMFLVNLLFKCESFLLLRHFKIVGHGLIQIH
jgi:hypothetical protein